MADVRKPQINLSFSSPLAHEPGVPVGRWEPFKHLSADVVRIPIAHIRPGPSASIRLSPDGSLYALGLDTESGNGDVIVVSLESGQLFCRLQVGMGWSIEFGFLGPSSLVVREETKHDTYLRAIDLPSGRATAHIRARCHESRSDDSVIWCPQAGFLLLVDADGHAPHAFVEDRAGTQPRLLTYPTLLDRAESDYDPICDVIGATYEDGVLQVDFARPVKRTEHFHIGVPTGDQPPTLIFGPSKSVLREPRSDGDGAAVRVVDAPGSSRWALAIDPSGAVHRIDRLKGVHGPDRSVACAAVRPNALLCKGHRGTAVNRDCVVIDTTDGSILAQWPLPKSKWRDPSPLSSNDFSDIGTHEDRWALVRTGTGWTAIDGLCEHEPVAIPGSPSRTIGGTRSAVFRTEQGLLVGEFPRLRSIALPEVPRGIVACRDEALAAVGEICVRIDLLSGRTTQVGRIVATTGSAEANTRLPNIQRNIPPVSLEPDEFERALAESHRWVLQDPPSRGPLYLDVHEGGTTLVIADGEFDLRQARYEPIPLEPPVTIDQTMHKQKLIAVSNDELRLWVTLAVDEANTWSAAADSSFVAVAMDGLTLIVGRRGEILRIDLSPHLHSRDAREPPPPLPRTQPRNSD